jgi:hypothetical protein
MKLDLNKAPRGAMTEQDRLFLELFDFLDNEDRSAYAALRSLIAILRQFDDPVVRTIADMLDPKIRRSWKLRLVRKGRARPNKRAGGAVLQMARRYQELTETLAERGEKKPGATARAILSGQYGYKTAGAFDVAVSRALAKDGAARKRRRLHKSRD